MPQSCDSGPAQSNSGALSCDCLAHRFGNVGDHPDRKPRYPSDMTDAQRAGVPDAMPVPPWLEGRGGQPLEATGISARPGREDAIALKDLFLDPACTAGKIAALLRTCPTTT